MLNSLYSYLFTLYFRFIMWRSLRRLKKILEAAPSGERVDNNTEFTE